MKKSLSVVVIFIAVTLYASGSNFRTPVSACIYHGPASVEFGDQEKKDTALKTVYTCEMHKAVRQDKEGKCPHCGMKLTAIKVASDEYSCPMHQDVISEKPGKCSKCGMNLVKKEPPKKAEGPKK